MDSIDFKFFIENDSNPFILFSNEGKIIYLNTSAEIVMGSIKSKELYELAVTYAPKSFGYNKTLINLSFGSFEFYGVNVLYQNEEALAIHLYNKPTVRIEDESLLKGYIITNLNILLQANIELFQIGYKGKIQLLTDYDIPEFQIHQNDFSLLLRHLFTQFIDSRELEIIMKIKLGERIMIKEKHYPIIILELKSSQRERKSDQELEFLALKNHINIHLREKSIVLEIPAIL